MSDESQPDRNLEPLLALRSIDDLLTPEERASLQADLAEMARLRRRAYDEARNIAMP